MYAPTSEHIEMDGVRIDMLTANEWRARTTAGFQDSVRLEAPFSESVGVGKLGRMKDVEQIRSAILAARAGSFVDSLPQGAHTQLGTTFGGSELSGGQWQKLVLDRAYMRCDPLLVVLDEPTAALDPLSELEVYTRQYAYAREMGRRPGTVTVIVSHRISTVRMADEIIVLDHAEIVECGSHAELMSNDGKCAKLYALQRDSYIRSSSDAGPSRQKWSGF
jgi:ATP-binding cassette subfamily B protein